MNGLIIAGGAVEDNFICDLIKTGAYEIIVAADSGIDVLYRNHITPDYLVGDFDSANPEAVSYYKDMDQVIVEELNPVKDDTDTEHALRKCIELGFENITMAGCIGDRMDHVLSNISLLGVGMEEGVQVELVGAKNRIRLLKDGISLKQADAFGDFFSLIPYQGPVTGLTVTGSKYDCQNLNMSPFTSLGVSNEIVADEITVKFKDGMLLMIESRD